jgi:hypothetical protein
VDVGLFGLSAGDGRRSEDEFRSSHINQFISLDGVVCCTGVLWRGVGELPGPAPRTI